GTKLERISPCANRSAIHVASFTSLLRPGTLRMCAALASTSSNSPSASSTCQTGFQVDAFELSSGEVLFLEGEKGHRMYVLLEGRMDVVAATHRRRLSHLRQTPRE